MGTHALARHLFAMPGTGAGYHIEETSPGRRWNAYAPDVVPDPGGWGDTPSVGHLLVQRYDDQPSIQNLYVHPDHQRRGVGRALWERAGRPKHVPGAQTDEGKAWADAVGGDDLWWAGNEHLRHGSLNEFLYRSAMPRRDAYDLVEHPNTWGDPIPGPPTVGEMDQTPVRPGPWYHSSDSLMEPGTILDPHDPYHPNSYSYFSELAPRDHQVFMHHSPAHTETYGKHLYEVEPLDEGPYAYNGEDAATGHGDGYAAPRARVIRRIERPRPQESIDLADAMSRMGRHLFGEAPRRLYRGLNLDTTAPGLERVHDLLFGQHQWDHPELGTHLLDGLSSLGGHWSADPAQAEQFARWPNEQTGHGGNLQAVIEADWDGQGEDPDRTDTHEFDDAGHRIRSFPAEQETTLLPGSALTVRGLRIRPYDDGYWNGPDDGQPVDQDHDGPWHALSMAPRQHTAGVPQTLYRGLTLDLDSPEGSFGAASPALRKILTQQGPESPEFVEELLRHGTGSFWTNQRGFAEGVNPTAGNGLQVVLTADWDGNGALPPEGFDQMMNMPGFDASMIPAQGPMGEVRVKPGKQFKVKSIQMRKKGEPSFRELLRQPMLVRARAIHPVPDRTAALLFAMPMRDAWDDEYKDQDKLMGSEYLPSSRRDIPGKDDPGAGWIHTSPRPHAVGDVLTPSRGQGASEWQHYYDATGHGSRRDWVWTSPKPKPQEMPQGDRSKATWWPWSSDDDYVYEIEPMDEGPFPFNGHGRDGWVVPRARVKTVLRAPLTPAPSALSPEVDALLGRPTTAARALFAMPYYHNTDAELNPGDELLSWADRNMGYDAPHRSKAWGYDPHSVYMYDQQGDPDVFALDFGKNRYEVEPIGAVTRDPEWEYNKVPYQEDLAEEPDSVYNDADVPGYHSYVAPRARVVRRLSRVLFAMPYPDAFDHGKYEGLAFDDPRRTEPTPGAGAWHHATDQDYQPGDVIMPNKGYYPSRFNTYYETHDLGERQNWVWMDTPVNSRAYWGNNPQQNVYEVEPLDEGPWPYNGDPDGGWGSVAPRARVIKRIKQKTAPPPRWEVPRNMVQRLIGPQPPDPNAPAAEAQHAASRLSPDERAMVLAMMTIDDLVRSAS